MTDHISCEMPDSNPLSDEIEKLLTSAKTIAIVGLSDKPERDSNKVGKYLKEHGFTIFPVNPTKDCILGEKSYKALADIPEHIDIVDIFRKIDVVPAVVDKAIEIKAGAVWMQNGLAHHVSAEKARKAGMHVVQSKCIMVEHKKMVRGK